MFSTIYKDVQKFLARIGWLRLGFGLAVLLLVLWFAGIFSGTAPASTSEDKSIRTVQVASIRDLSLNIAPLSVVGTVTSKSEATVRAESSGQLTGVYRSLGDSIAAGSVIAEIENATQRAAVLQAEAGVTAALSAGNVQETSLKAAQDTAATSLLSAYAAVQNTIEGSIDDMFANPNGSQPKLIVQTADTQAKIDTESMRLSINAIIAREKAQSASISGSINLMPEIAKTEAELRTIREFIDLVIRALNTGITTEGVTASELATYKANATAARTTVTSALSTLITSRQSLEVAQKNSSDIGTSVTGLASAQATLASARAQLEKTIVRAPISGTINSLSLKRGDYVQAATPVVTIANNGALEVVAYITEGDSREIKVGGTAEMSSGSRGTITHIAPALDPATKKIEVRIGITDDIGNLINGQSVTVRFTRSNTATATTPVRIVIPIAALKIGAEEVVVFSVDADNKLVSHPVTLGTLLGDRVVITDGITFEDVIVTDARGLQAGETVALQ